jgi:uncharacterized membrane protein YdbT with pleckstrin-like domain
MNQEQQNFTTGSPMAPVMAVKDWVITMILMIIPIVNIVLLIVWATSQTENPNRKNWALAQLIFMVIGIVIYLLFFVLIFGMISGM